MSKKLLSLGVAALCALSSVAQAQSVVPISQLPAAANPLAGSELIPCVQGGVTKNCLASNLGKAAGGIPGTTTNDNAPAGSIGEYLTVSSGTIALTTGAAIDTATLSLTAGDWDVQAVIEYSPAGSTIVQSTWSSIGTVSNTLPPFPQRASVQIVHAAGVGEDLASPVIRISISSTTTIRAIALANFTTSTCNAIGFIRARRVR